VLKEISDYTNQKTKVYKEVQMLKNVSHANIIKYYYSFTHKDNLYIVMEYADGGDLY
jgi:serine/threonine protein kinase